MDERRDPEPPAERRPAVIAAAASKLSPVQQAWQRYVDHSLYDCDVCRAVDGSPCKPAEDLYADWRRISGAALDAVRES